MLGKPCVLSLFLNSFNKINKTWALISDILCKQSIKYSVYRHHWRSSHYAVKHVHNKNSNIQGRSPIKCVSSDFPYYKELLIKERIRTLLEQILSLKRSSHFEEGPYRWESRLDPVVSCWCAYYFHHSGYPNGLGKGAIQCQAIKLCFDLYRHRTCRERHWWTITGTMGENVKV